MRRKQRKAVFGLVSAATVVALATGLTVSPSVAQDRVTARVQLRSGGVAATDPAAATGRQLTLITGDRVLLDAEGGVAALLPAKGRESVPVVIRKVAGHTYALPSDTARMIAQGRLDIRLFDVTELSRTEYKELAGDGVPLIVTYKGARPAAKAQLHADADPAVRATLDTVDGEALTVAQPDAAEAWRSLTDASATGRRAASGVDTIWLDGLVHASLDVSVPQIGAPAAWQAGYDGKGVKVAVLDTGIDTRHPDVGGKVIAEKNFTTTADTQDHYGHGTHVASIVAGTGAASQGKYTGVAPGAELINGKVMNDGGSGTESGIIAGMEWAVEQGAQVVNLSLGGVDSPGVDPMEETVNRLSDKALFVIAAGNSGPGAGTLGSPGTADGALTVGAVDKQNVLADFSSRGPRIADGGLKPDLTAPGVDITAAAAAGSRIDTSDVPHPAPGYLTISGTSMATPHVAGSAALLAQEHPGWTARQLKTALIGSAEPGPYSPYEQGSGRVDVARAVGQSVFAEPGSLDFGAQQWPHSDDQPVTKPLTYRNTGTADITLDLTTTTSAPGGGAAPDGFFTLGAQRITVPAGGTASVDVTADSRAVAGETLGGYGVVVTATGGGQSVRTAGALDREAEMYDLNFQATGRDGQAMADGDWTGWVFGIDNDVVKVVSGDRGLAQLRLPKGKYMILGEIPVLSTEGAYIGDDWTVQPKLELGQDTVIDVDARQTKPIDVTVPDPNAGFQSGSVIIQVKDNGGVYPTGLYWGDMSEGFRTRQIGAATPADELTSYLIGHWLAGDVDYTIADTLDGAFYTGHTQHVQLSDLAKITVPQGGSVTGRWAQIVTQPSFPAAGTAAFVDLPYTATAYVQGGYSWTRSFTQVGGRAAEAQYEVPAQVYKAGKSYTQPFNTGVFGPKIGEDQGLVRDGDTLTGTVQLFSDAAGHDGRSLYDTASASTTLYRDGKEYATFPDILDVVSFQLPPDKAHYRLVTTAARGPAQGHALSTKVTAEYTFTSGHTSKAVSVPASAVRYTPELALDGTAAAGARLSVPVTVQGAAAGDGLEELTVYVSYDSGVTWTKVRVQHGKVSVTNPAAGGSVSFRAKAKAVGTDGNTVTQTIIDAYRTK
ncbi:MAG: hypothetical protein QOF44_1641 [Streptomyces sp.]|nr:hypothetical protein [Streptomyces sp.]